MHKRLKSYRKKSEDTKFNLADIQELNRLTTEMNKLGSIQNASLR